MRYSHKMQHGGALKHHAEGKVPSTKRSYTYFTSPFIRNNQRRHTHKNGKQVSGCQRLRKKGMTS